MSRCLSLLALLLLLGCVRDEVAAPMSSAPPNGGGHVEGADGVARTRFQSAGVLVFGDQVTGALSAAEQLRGYEFEAQMGVVPQLTIQTTGQVQLALYGPRRDSGLWGEAIVHTTETVLTGPGLAQDGVYFVLLYTLANEGDAYSLRLDCVGDTCPAPSCPEMRPCDLYCVDGYDADATGCRRCACGSATACVNDDGCAVGERCVDGHCDACAASCHGVEPVCGADGRTYANPCSAACAQVENLQRGPCESLTCDDAHPCPASAVCERGRCVRDDCGCGDEVEVVCAEDGRSFRNPCALECAGQRLAYPGRCIERRCDAAHPCQAGEACLPALSVPGNARLCAEDPESDACVHACVPSEATLCDHDEDCPPSTRCVERATTAGVCAPPCRLRGDDCGPGHICAAIDATDTRAGEGRCLPGCPDRACPRPLVCIPDLLNQPTCQPVCACRDEGAPVCADGVTFPSACHAQCVGRERFELGACTAPPCITCPAPDGGLACADDTLYATACDAACVARRPEPADTCYEMRIPRACREDADCLTTGCDDSVCAAEPARVCAPLSEGAMCMVEAGACGCVRGRCDFALTRAAMACLQAVRASD